MTAGRTLVDALRQVAHVGDPVGDLLAEQHAAATGLGSLPDHHLDRIRAAQILRIHAVTRRQVLIHERLRMTALLIRHTAVAGGGRRSRSRRTASECFLGGTGECSEAHAGDGDRNLQMDRLLREARSQNDGGVAFLAVAFERIARDRCAEKEKVVEMRDLALGAGASDIINAGRSRTADFRKRIVVEGRGLARRGIGVVIAHTGPCL